MVEQELLTPSGQNHARGVDRGQGKEFLPL